MTQPKGHDAFFIGQGIGLESRGNTIRQNREDFNKKSKNLQKLWPAVAANGWRGGHRKPKAKKLKNEKTINREPRELRERYKTCFFPVRIFGVFRGSFRLRPAVAAGRLFRGSGDFVCHA
jgi:hypothetical protein